MSMFTAEYQDFKREDPTVLVKVTLYDDQKNVIKPVISKAKLVQGTKYAGDYEITQDGDQYCLSTKQIAKLPSGSYGMELWGDDGSIYPSAGFIPIRIHRNADDSLEKTKPTIDLDSIIEDLHKAGLNVVFDKIEMLDSNQPASVTSSVRDGKNHITLKIPRGIKGDTGATGPQGPKGDKGDKGDTGTVDNAGLTTAPAFVELQTQVNNSAVGTNLLTGTSSDLKTKQLTNDWNVSTQATNGNYKIKAVKGQTYTYRAWLDNTNGPDQAFVSVRLFPIGASTDFALGVGKAIKNGETGYSTFVFTAPEDGYIELTPFAYGKPETALVEWKEEKLEKGSVATDWCPNPAEILTQADYAKIQAAIVALGGSLK